MFVLCLVVQVSLNFLALIPLCMFGAGALVYSGADSIIFVGVDLGALVFSVADSITLVQIP